MARNLLRCSKQMMRQEFTAKRLQDSAQGFNPGSDVPKKCAPKVAPERSLQTVGVADRFTNASYGFWRPFSTSNPADAGCNSGRARVPARREQVYVINLVKPWILVCPGARIRRIARTRSLPVAGLAALPGRKTMRSFRALHKTMPNPGLKPWAESCNRFAVESQFTP
jgi:hypothetical protein